MTENAIKREYSPELADMKGRYRDTVSRLTATVRRCPPVLILVSESSHKSVSCQLEAHTAGVIHGFWPENRIRNEAEIYFVLEHSGLSPLPGLEQFWSQVYEEGLEDALARVIAGGNRAAA